MTSKEPAAKKLSKKEARQLVYEKLNSALSEFKTGIKGKKFESNLQKASKLFADDMVKAEKEKTKKTTKNKKQPSDGEKKE